MILETFYTIFNRIREREDMPQNFNDVIIISVFKKQRQHIRLWQLLWHYLNSYLPLEKILVHIIVKYLISAISEENLPEVQCGYHPCCGTVDMIFAVSQVQDKFKEQNLGLYAVFIDLTKAFDPVNREGLWAILERFSCPGKFMNLICLFHDNMKGLVLSTGETSDMFAALVA